MDYLVLWNEGRTDPLGRGYSGMTDREIAIDLNTVYRTRMRETLSSAEVYEAIEISEFQALGDVQKVYVRDILGLGDGIRVGSGTKARQMLINIFGAGSDTIAALADILSQNISRATELGLPRVYPHHVTLARERYGG